MFPTFDELLDERLWMFDFEVSKYDWLLVLIKYSDRQKIIFHNNCADDIFTFIQENNPMLIGHNARYYDQYILKAILSGFSVSEVKEVNDYIINGGQGFELQYDYIKLPPILDTIQDIVPPKSLKEIEANLCMDITESTVDFNIDHAWDTQEYDEMLYYCTKDVEALFPLFEARKSYFMAKYTICTMGDIPPDYGMGYTNARLTAMFLKARAREYNDGDTYEYPNNFELEEIPKKIKDYFDKFINGELDIHKEKLSLVIDDMRGNVQEGGLHFALDNYKFERDDFKASDYYE